MRRLHVVRNSEDPSRWLIHQQSGNGKDDVWTEEKEFGDYGSREEAIEAATKLPSDSLTFDSEEWELEGYDTIDDWAAELEQPPEETPL